MSEAIKKSVWVFPLSQFQIDLLSYMFRHSEMAPPLGINIVGISFTDKMDLIIDIIQNGKTKRAIATHDDSADSFIYNNRTLNFKQKE